MNKVTLAIRKIYYRKIFKAYKHRVELSIICDEYVIVNVIQDLSRKYQVILNSLTTRCMGLIDLATNQRKLYCACINIYSSVKLLSW